jgi:hypothetical protein
MKETLCDGNTVALYTGARPLNRSLFWPCHLWWPQHHMHYTSEYTADRIWTADTMPMVPEGPAKANAKIQMAALLSFIYMYLGHHLDFGLRYGGTFQDNSSALGSAARCIIARHLVMWTCNHNEVKQVQKRLQEVECKLHFESSTNGWRQSWQIVLWALRA